jgi:hypothetical protein
MVWMHRSISKRAMPERVPLFLGNILGTRFLERVNLHVRNSAEPIEWI